MNTTETIDEVVDSIIDYLGWETWKQVGAFMEDIHAAIHLPLQSDMWWTMNTRPMSAQILQGSSSDYRVIAYANGNTLEEAVCRAWLVWKRANDIERFNQQNNPNSAELAESEGE
jgi:hypothetical protein